MSTSSSTPSPIHLTNNPTGIKAFIDQFDVFLFDCDELPPASDQDSKAYYGPAIMSLKAQERRWRCYDGEVCLVLTRPVLVLACPVFHQLLFFPCQSAPVAIIASIQLTPPLLIIPGKRIIFVTNNSTKSRADYKTKLDAMSIPCTVDEIFGSAYSSAIYISRILRPTPPTNKVFILGEAGIESELALAGVPFTGGTDASFQRGMTPADFGAIASGAALDPHVSIVLAGLDYHVNYLKLALAHAYLRRGATFLATNADSTLPSAGALFPGAGAVTSAPLAYMTGKQPVVLGKPSLKLLDAVEEGLGGVQRGRICMVGDRLDTDIRFGVEGGLGGTLAVLTGVSRREEWEVEGAVVRPGWFVDGLADLRAGLGDGESVSYR